LTKYWSYKAIKRTAEYLALIIVVAFIIVSLTYTYASQQPGTSASVEAGRMKATVLLSAKIAAVATLVALLIILLIDILRGIGGWRL